MFDEVVRIRGRLGELVTALDPDAVTGHTARQLWAEFDGVERLAAAGKTLLARRVADTHRRDHTGTGNAAQELARRAGTTTKAARDALDTSARLADLPEVDAAIRRGELSPAQAELISDAAAANPDAGPALVALARRTSAVGTTR